MIKEIPFGVQKYSICSESQKESTKIVRFSTKTPTFVA